MFGRNKNQDAATQEPQGSGRHVVHVTDPNGHTTTYSGMTTTQRDNTIRNARRHPGYEAGSSEIPA